MQKKAPEGLEAVLQEIEKALQSGFYYTAIVMTLTLPDICAALESPDGRTERKLYKKWYNDNLSLKFPNLTASDCYSLRCGVVHQGRMGLAGSQFGRVIFTLPSRRGTAHNCVINDALQFDAISFCNDVLEVVRKWLETAFSNGNGQCKMADY